MCVCVLARVSFSSVYVCVFSGLLCALFSAHPCQSAFDVLAHLSVHVRFLWFITCHGLGRHARICLAGLVGIR